jgi:hypothetical protein
VSITLGIYDVFSYAIPGILYLFTFNEGLKLLHLPFVDTSLFSNGYYLFLLALLAYLVGHLFDYISHDIWYRRFYRGKSEERAYSDFKIRSGLKPDFEPHQWSMLLSVIRHNNMEVCNIIDKDKATSIMLRNVSFALFLLTIVLAISAFISTFSPVSLLGAIAALIGSFVSLRRGDVFNQSFYRLIYQQSLLYGTSLKEILENNRSKMVKDDKPTSRMEKRG